MILNSLGKTVLSRNESLKRNLSHVLFVFLQFLFAGGYGSTKESITVPCYAHLKIKHAAGLGLAPKALAIRLAMNTWPITIHLRAPNRTIAIASDFRVDGAKSPEIPQKEGVLGSEIAARNRKSLATFHRTLKSQCSTAFSCLGDR